MAWFNRETRRAEVLKNADGDEKTPSLVCFLERDTLVGKHAENALADEEMRPLVYPPGAKRDLGKRTMAVAIGGRLVRPHDVAVEVLRKLKHDAEELHFHTDVPRAVITVPATFDQWEHGKVEEAGGEAGFREVVLLQEPVAAAMAYVRGGYQVGHRILVFDLGGGTFDLAVLARDGQPDSFALDQEPRGLRKGGEDFDRALYALLERKAREAGRSLGDHGALDLAILQRCRDFKENLSVRSEVTFSTYLRDGRPFQNRLDRGTFEALIKETIAETVDLTEEVLRTLAARGHQLDAVVLVGGSSRVPLVTAMLEARVPIKPQKWHNQDVAVALGAAYHAETLWGRARPAVVPPPPTDVPVGELRRIDFSTDEVHGVAMAPDGRHALSATLDGIVRLWDLKTRKEVRRFEGHIGWIRSVAIAPDGRRALSGGDDRTLRLWDLESGRQLHCFKRHSRRIMGVAIAPDGRRALSASHDGTVWLWDLETGCEIRSFEARAGEVRSAAFAPDGRRVLSGGADGSVRLWDAQIPGEVCCLKGHSDSVDSVAVALDGRHALSGGHDKRLRLWDLDTARELRCISGHDGLVRSVAIAPDGRRALSGSDDGTVRLWDLDTGREFCRLKGHVGRVRSVTFSPSGRRALSGGDDGTIRLWGLPI
jgi:WD40 repeat protein